MCFHRVHGRNARLSRNRLTASRATVYSEFNHAVLFSSRPLRECEMFELRIDKMVDCWIGSLEIGTTFGFVKFVIYIIDCFPYGIRQTKASLKKQACLSKFNNMQQIRAGTGP